MTVTAIERPSLSNEPIDTWRVGTTPWESLRCYGCESVFTREAKRGRKPFTCPSCDDRGVKVTPSLSALVEKPAPVIRAVPNGPMRHYLFDDILAVMREGEQPMLVGGAGGGKSTIAEHIAQELNLPLFQKSFHGLLMESDLLGFMTAGGEFSEGVLIPWLRNGGVMLLDEIDAGNPSAIVAMNYIAAIAPGSSTPITLANGEVITRHENALLMAGANTDGTGADAQYSAREQLDAASLDRFCFIAFDYDEELERRIAGNDEWVLYVQKIRAAVRKAGLHNEFLVTPRASIRGARLLKAGLPKAKVEAMVLFKNMPADVKRNVLAYA